MARLATLSIAAATALLLAGCTPTAPSTTDDGRLHIVASTNVYGSIAELIGGDLVEVTSLITSASQDPHSYEASAQDQLALSKADLVIENGGGYDPFIDTLLDASSSAAVVLTASEASGLLEGHDHADEGDDHADEDESGAGAGGGQGGAVRVTGAGRGARLAGGRGRRGGEQVGRLGHQGYSHLIRGSSQAYTRSVSSWTRTKTPTRSSRRSWTTG